MSVFLEASDYLTKVRNGDGILQTQPFLDVCRVVVKVVEKLGTAFYVVKQDVNGNIDRLAQKASQDPERYALLLTIVQDEVVQKQHDSNTSCTKGLLWLKRAMEFVTALLNRLVDQPAEPLSTVVKETYSQTLSKYHGYVVSCAFAMAFAFVPTREDFIDKLISSGNPGIDPNLEAELRRFTASFTPILQELHEYFTENGLDDPTKV